MSAVKFKLLPMATPLEKRPSRGKVFSAAHPVSEKDITWPGILLEIDLVEVEKTSAEEAVKKVIKAYYDRSVKVELVASESELKRIAVYYVNWIN